MGIDPSKELDGSITIYVRSEGQFQGAVGIIITKLSLTKKETLSKLKEVSWKNLDLDNEWNWNEWEQVWESYFETLKK